MGEGPSMGWVGLSSDWLSKLVARRVS